MPPGDAQAAIRLARESGDGALDSASIAHIDRAQLHPKRPRRALDGGELGDSGGQDGIPNDRRSCHPWRGDSTFRSTEDR